MRAARHYDERLPILAELEAQVEQAARRHRDAQAAARAPARPRRESRRTGGLRVPRRVAVLASLLFLLAATATAAVTVWPGGGSEPTPARLLVEESAGAFPHRLEIHELDGRACTTLILADTVDSACAEKLRRTEVSARSAMSAFAQYVYGLTGSGVRAIEIRVAGTATRTVSVRPLPAAARSELPAARGLRYFVARLPRQSGNDGGETIRVAAVTSSPRDGSASCVLPAAGNAGCRTR